MSDYSRGDYADLPAGTTDLENNYTAPDLTAIASNDNSTYAEQTANNEIAIHQYKKTVTGQYTNITWSGKSSLAPSESPVIMEVYNVTGTPAWEELDRDDSTAADTDFDLSYDNLATADYLDTGVITWRVYQAASGAPAPSNYAVASSTEHTDINNHTLVKTSAGKLYCFYSSGDYIRVKWFNAGTWTATTSFGTQNTYVLSVAINSSDYVGVFYLDSNSGSVLKYVLFNTSDDSWGTPVAINFTMTTTGQSYQKYDLVFDSADKAHAVWSDNPGTMTTYYSNNVSGWLATPITVEASTLQGYASITIAKNATPGYPVIAHFSYPGARRLSASIGDANNAASFTTQIIASVSDDTNSSIAVDSNGDISIAYSNSSGSALKVIKHLHSDGYDGSGWAIWQTPEPLSASNYNEPSIAIDGTDRYVFAVNTTTGNIWVFVDTGSWDAGTDIQTSYSSPKARWSPFNNPSYASSGIEYTFEDATPNLVSSTHYL